MVTRRTFLQGALGASAATLLAGCNGLFSSSTGTSSGPIFFGVSGPFSGDNAEYGAIWKKGFGLALDEINGAGGIHGRKVQLVYEDSQSDPKQSVPIAQKFVNDSRILAELGDFSSPASMAASPIYERAKLVQFGFTNSHPKFTLGGDFMFSTSLTQQESATYMADVAVNKVGKKHVVLYLDTDWGNVTQGIYVQHAKSIGGQILFAASYLSDEKDFKSLLLKVRDANPDVLALISYYNDGALIAQQARSVGLTAKIVAASSCYSPQFIALGGDAVNNVILTTEFFPSDPRPEVQRFVAAFQKRYNEKPDLFGAGSYDALKVLAWAVEHGGADRVAIQQALLHGTNIPSVMYGPFKFGPDRRIDNAQQFIIKVQNGQFVQF